LLFFCVFRGVFVLFIYYGHPGIHYHFLNFFLDSGPRLRWPVSPLQLSFAPPWLKPLVTPLVLTCVCVAGPSVCYDPSSITTLFINTLMLFQLTDYCQMVRDK